jgi:hypothetical protein
MVDLGLTHVALPVSNLNDSIAFWVFLHIPPNMQCTAYSGICGVQEYAES